MYFLTAPDYTYAFQFIRSSLAVAMSTCEVLSPHSESVTKKRKTDKPKKERKVIPNQCEYFMVQKQRRCAMKRKKDRRFCSEHIKFDDTQSALEVKDERVDCPLDQKHSVWKRDLEVHLKKCPAKPVEKPAEWFEKGWNTRLQNGAEHSEENGQENNLKMHKTLGTSQKLPEKDDFLRVAELIRKFSETVEPLVEDIKSHPGLENWHEDKENRKHIDQQSSLVAHMKAANLLSSNHFYVEFGCGRAELLRTVNACILHEGKAEENQKSDSYGFGLIDRGVNRMKFDTKMVKDCEKSLTSIVPIVKRLRIDIEHLHLDRFLQDLPVNQVVGISKHLCGVATDLTLKLILNSETVKEKFQGLVVAMCCRHACNWRQLLPQLRAFLREHGIANENDFKVLKTIVTWAVCGPGSTEETGKLATGLNHVSGLEYTERERLGLLARRMIDVSRVSAAKTLFGPDFQVRLFTYATRATTPENSCLHICRK